MGRGRWVEEGGLESGLYGELEGGLEGGWVEEGGLEDGLLGIRGCIRGYTSF